MSYACDRYVGFHIIVGQQSFISISAGFCGKEFDDDLLIFSLLQYTLLFVGIKADR